MAPLTLVPTHLSDHDLLAEVTRLAACEREATAALVAALAEMDARRLHLAEGYSSLFAYCTERLHLSEHAAYHRIEAARTVRAFPVILAALQSGDVTLTAVTLLRPHLTQANHADLLDAARGRSKRDVEMLVRSVAPLPEVRTSVRKVSSVAAPSTPALLARFTEAAQHASSGGELAGSPASADSERSADLVVGQASSLSLLRRTSRSVDPAPDAVLASDAAAAAMPSIPNESVERSGGNAPAAQARPRPAEVRALAPDRYSLRVTLSADAHAKLCRAQDLLRHAVPDGDPAAVVDRALTLLVDHLERRKFAARKEAARVTQRPARARKYAEPFARTAAAPARTAAAPVAAEGRDRREPTGTQASPVNDEPGTNRTEAPCAPMAPSGSGVPPAGGHDVERRRLERRFSRHIPAAVRRAVWARDEGRCAFTGAGGRCRETGRLEFHHRIPVADGGEATVQNLELRCSSHHAYESRRWFGDAWRRCETVCGMASPARTAGTRPGPS